MKAFSLLLVGAALLMVSSVGHAQSSKESAEMLTTDEGGARLAVLAPSDSFAWAPLQPGIDLYAGSDRYQWVDVPEELRSVRFLQLPKHTGVLTFSVATTGYVFIATTTRWGGGGNSSGDWQDEVMLERDLRRAGWKKVRTFRDLTTNDTGEMAVFCRPCQAGETHRIRTEKYAAPMLLIR